MQKISILLSNALLLGLILGILLHAQRKRVKVYDSFIEGAKQGFDLVLMILPHVVGMLVAIGMLRSSGFFATLGKWLEPILSPLGIPADIIPLALMRPLSSAGANAITIDIIHQHGGDALISQIAGTLLGSTETTFYVLAVYFGSIGIKNTRHAVAAGLSADLAGVIAAIVIGHWLFA